MGDGECGFGQGEHGRVPLVRLLHRAETAYVAEFDRRLAETAYTSLTLAHSRGVLRHLGGGPVRASRLVDDCGVSKQAVSQQIAQLEAAGYVAVTADPSDARARVVTLTERGAAAQQTVHHLFVQIEADWARRIGSDELEGLRRALTELGSCS